MALSNSSFVALAVQLLQENRMGVLKKANLLRSSLPKKLPGGVFPQPSSLWDTTPKLALGCQAT